MPLFPNERGQHPDKRSVVEVIVEAGKSLSVIEPADGAERLGDTVSASRVHKAWRVVAWTFGLSNSSAGGEEIQSKDMSVVCS